MDTAPGLARAANNTMIGAITVAGLFGLATGDPAAPVRVIPLALAAMVALALFTGDHVALTGFAVVVAAVGLIGVLVGGGPIWWVMLLGGVGVVHGLARADRRRR